jgi:hypothetical protein
MHILFGVFNAKVGKEGMFKLRIGNESLHEISNDKVLSAANFVTSKNISQEEGSVLTS